MKNLILLACAWILFTRPTHAEAPPLLLQHLSQPLQAESTMDALEPWETPISGFFIRSHHTVPNTDPKDWVLVIDGLVDKPLTLRFKDLENLPQTSFHSVLQCSGNGRGRQTPPVPGIQWIKGAVGNGYWTGVALSELLKLAKVQPEAKYARLQGADLPAFPSVPAFVRSVPLSKLMENGSLLALKMNREPLPTLHGGPMRLVFDRWYGENWIKWVTHITLTREEDPGFYMKKGYRYPKEPVSPGKAWDSSTGKAIEELPVQSLITSPRDSDEVLPGLISVRGKAFSGHGPIEKVELSFDQGKTWKLATLEKPHTTGGWQEFTAQLTLEEPGQQLLWSRATDSKGNQQPIHSQWNPGGYLKNEVDSVHFTVLRSGSGEALIQSKCLTCHHSNLITTQRLTPLQWTGVLKKMEAFGVQLQTGEKELLLQTLTRRSKDPATPMKAPPLMRYPVVAQTLNQASGDSKKGQAIYKRNCALCHGDQGEGKIGPRILKRRISPQDFHEVLSHGRREMPAFASILNPQEMTDLFTFINPDGNP